MLALSGECIYNLNTRPVIGLRLAHIPGLGKEVPQRGRNRGVKRGMRYLVKGFAYVIPCRKMRTQKGSRALFSVII
jgi:hypothetical protein